MVPFETHGSEPVRHVEHVGYMTLVLLSAAIAVVATGLWRLAFVPFGIRRSRMTIERLGFAAGSPANAERVNGILAAFAGGFNAMIGRPSRTAWIRYCDSLPPVYRPFAHEGSAMGHTLRRLGRYRPEVFEDQIVRARPAFVYLSYVGLGFWSGMRGHEPARLTRIAENLDPLHGALCYDGYGFKHGFFDYLKDPACLRRLEAFDGYPRHVAYQGVGRSFWFLFMGEPDRLIAHVGRLGPYARDAAGGLGLAAVFVFPDRLEVAQALGDKLPDEWHDDFHLGMCFGLKARSLGEMAEFARNVGRMDANGQKAIWASLRACDRIEHQVRGETATDGYQRWREQVRQWMAEHITYPLAGLEQPVAATPDRHTVAT